MALGFSPSQNREAQKNLQKVHLCTWPPSAVGWPGAARKGTQPSQDGPQATAYCIDPLLIIHMRQGAPSLGILVKC